MRAINLDQGRVAVLFRNAHDGDFDPFAFDVLAHQLGAWVDRIDFRVNFRAKIGQERLDLGEICGAGHHWNQCGFNLAAFIPGNPGWKLDHGPTFALHRGLPHVGHIFHIPILIRKIDPPPFERHRIRKIGVWNEVGLLGGGRSDQPHGRNQEGKFHQGTRATMAARLSQCQPSIEAKMRHLRTGRRILPRETGGSAD